MKKISLYSQIETKKILKKAIQANRALARLNGVAQIIPNQNILINSLILQEAKDSSTIEIISVYKKAMLKKLKNFDIGHTLCTKNSKMLT